jgi:regulatory protein
MTPMGRGGLQSTGCGEMAGTISALVAQKRNKERVNVYLDGRYAFSLPTIEAARLCRGQYLSDEEIELLQELDTFQKAYDQALRFLAYRPRSHAETLRYLERKGIPPPLAEKVIERLVTAGLLDDLAFARFWVENRDRFNPRGARALRYELRRKGLSAEIIQQALSEAAAEGEAIYSAALTKARQLVRLDHDDFKRRLGAYLARRGFSYEAIAEVVERLWQEVAEG